MPTVSDGLFTVLATAASRPTGDYPKFLKFAREMFSQPRTHSAEEIIAVNGWTPEEAKQISEDILREADRQIAENACRRIFGKEAVATYGALTVRLDPTVPRDTIELRDGDRTVGVITNLRTEDRPCQR